MVLLFGLFATILIRAAESPPHRLARLALRKHVGNVAPEDFPWISVVKGWTETLHTDCVISKWGRWSSCQRHCGDTAVHVAAFYTRTRRIIEKAYRGRPCPSASALRDLMACGGAFEAGKTIAYRPGLSDCVCACQRTMAQPMPGAPSAITANAADVTLCQSVCQLTPAPSPPPTPAPARMAPHKAWVRDAATGVLHRWRGSVVAPPPLQLRLSALAEGALGASMVVALQVRVRTARPLQGLRFDVVFRAVLSSAVYLIRCAANHVERQEHIR